MRPTLLPAVFLGAAFALTGCTTAVPPVPPAAATPAKDAEEAHEHNRANMMSRHAGKLLVWLTAHLSKDGNEIDLFVEEHDEPKPVALPIANVKAKAVRASDGKEFDVVFEPASASERPKGEAAGTCSHFVAKVPWMTADDLITLTAEVEVDGRLRKPKWASFSPKKYAHHHD